MPTKPPTRITLLAKPKRPHRNEIARNVATMREVADLVRELRSGLDISQALLAARAGVGRQWVIALEQGQPTLEAANVFRVLETLGFELVHPPTTRRRPRCCGPAARPSRSQGHRRRGAGAEEHARGARARRLAENEPTGRVFLE